MQAREEALRRSKRKKMGRMGPPKPTRMGKIEERPMMTVGMMERLKERRRRQAIQAAGPGMLTGGQAKLDKNKNNKIDAQDFKILRAEKAKGRGQGLQDEKMKPGKIMKADKGGMTGAKYRKYLKGLKAVGKFPGIRTAGALRQSMKDASKEGVKGFLERRAKLAGTTVKGMERAAKATRLGKIAAGVAAIGLGAKEFLKRKMEKNKNKPQKKMGGGMMMRPNPVGYKTGKSVKVKCKLGKNKPTKMY